MVRNSYHIVLILILLLLCSKAVKGQQFGQYTQYLSNELVVNPAYAGSEGALSLNFINRRQWINVEGAPETQTFTAHSQLINKSIGIGAIIINERIGVHRNLSALAVYAYRIELNKESTLSFGLQAGIRNNRSDYSSLLGQVQNPQDPKLGVQSLSFNSFEFGAGIYFKNQKLKLGLSSPKLAATKRTFYDSLSYQFSRSHFYFLTSYVVPVTANFDFQPGLLLKYLPGLPVSFDVNMLGVINKVLTLGATYRYKESVGLIVQGKIWPQLSFGYAYDHAVGTASVLHNGSHEFMINYLFKFSTPGIKKPR